MLHRLHYDGEVPKCLNNPFYYQPDPLSQKAIDELAAYLSDTENQRFASHHVNPDFKQEIAQGKMFGVLVVKNSTTTATTSNARGDKKLYYLAGYSGQICGRSDWDEFVPAVFDYLEPDGFFKREEAEIVSLSHDIDVMPRPLKWEEMLENAHQPVYFKGRKADEDEEAYIRRRQFENAELHRWKLKMRQKREKFEAYESQKAKKIASLKTLRRQKSDALQTWLFRQFVMQNGRGEKQNLIEIFQKCQLSGTIDSTSNSKNTLPPAGTGECCEPKLLQYAFKHGLIPISMAMLWWGKSPRGEVRHHLACYPACHGKCKPLLHWMLQGIEVAPNALEEERHHSLETIYDDEDICVVNKPAGMLSVPGKSQRENVYNLIRQRYPDATGPLIAHRLDMATSGLMVVAKSMQAYLNLQAQFAKRQISKRYVAILSKPLTQATGKISLPLRPDLMDRPRQIVDWQHGKSATTHFERIDSYRVALYPLTGRTHQLRVHCAHRDGLNNPIKGDDLYGQHANRLYLHAERLVFKHPSTGKRMEFSIPAPF